MTQTTTDGIVTQQMIERAARAYVRAVQATFEDAEQIDYKSKDWKRFED